MNCIEVETLGEAWINSMKLIMSSGEMINDEDILLKEKRNLYITINDISEEDKIIKKYANKERIELMKKKYFTCGLVGDYKIDYGSYIFNNKGVNQFDWLCEKLKNKPETKSATISLHIAGENKLTCLSLLDFKLRNNKLFMTAVYRSQNVFSSQPGNIIALRDLQKALADNIKVDIGNFELVVMSAHIYQYDFENVEKLLNEYDKYNNI